MKTHWLLLVLTFAAWTMPVRALDTCGVAKPWAEDHYDDYFSRVLPCSQAFVTDVWKRFDMQKDAWQLYGYEEDACNYNTPLGRTISALELLSYAGTNNPHCDYRNDLVLNWAFCFAGNAIHELLPVCDSPTASATTFYGTLELDPRTELHKAFFYDFGVPVRAATIFHESRHADGWCTHNKNCPAGRDNNSEACDPSFENGCVGFSSSSGKGAYGWGVIWLQRYATQAQPDLISPDLQALAVDTANTMLFRNFSQDPCFRLATNGDVVAVPGC